MYFIVRNQLYKQDKIAPTDYSKNYKFDDLYFSDKKGLSPDTLKHI